MVRTWISPKATKGAPSEISGCGLVAVDAISEGEVVAVKGGHVRTTQQMRSLPERLQNSGVQITDDLHLMAVEDHEYEAVMLFLNHSCDPNVGFAGNVVLVAMRDIAAGEELTTDYAMFDDHEDSMECACGRPACRRVVDGQDWRKPDLQKRYRGYFSWYLQRRM
jgi:SET domain-containing protein